MEPSKHHYLCSVCSHTVLVGPGEALSCETCGHKDTRTKPKSARLSLVFSMTALIFYLPAMLFPFMTVELYGSRTSSTIWSGIMELAASGSVAIAVIVFLASVLIPVIKLLILFYLSLSWKSARRQRFKTSLYHFVEAIGRWSMLDIFLLAVLVAVMKLGPMTQVQPEKGAALFALVVIFTMLSSAYYDPRILWESKSGKKD